MFRGLTIKTITEIVQIMADDRGVIALDNFSYNPKKKVCEVKCIEDIDDFLEIGTMEITEEDIQYYKKLL